MSRSAPTRADDELCLRMLELRDQGRSAAEIARELGGGITGNRVYVTCARISADLAASEAR